MAYGPALTALAVGVLSVLFSRSPPMSGSDPLAIQGAVAPDREVEVDVSHRFIGEGLKRDYELDLDFTRVPTELGAVRVKVTWDMPASLIVDPLKLNRDRTGGEAEQYRTDKPVDLEVGLWDERAVPYQLQADVLANLRDERRKRLLLPEAMLRYRQHYESCGHLPSPTISIAGYDVVIKSPGSPLYICPPAAIPSLTVPVLTIMSPFLLCLLLAVKIIRT